MLSCCSFLQKRGVKLYFYLDDWLIVAKSPVQLRSHTELVLDLVKDLGFLVNLNPGLGDSTGSSSRGGHS